MYEERLLLDQNKNSSVFARPNNPDLVANGGYDQADNQCIRYGYDQASIKYGRCGYCCQADNQYGGDGYNQIDYQYSRYGCDHRDDDQYGEYGCGQVDIKKYGVNRHIGGHLRYYCYDNCSYAKSIHWEGWYKCL